VARQITMEDPFYESLMARSPLGRGYQAAPSQSGPVDPEEQKRKEDTDGWFADTLMAIPRGVAGAVESVGELGNLFGADYDLPDNFGLGHSTSLPGSLTQGTVQFLTGFLPGSWGVGHLSRLSKASKIAKTAKAAGSTSSRTKAAQILNTAAVMGKGRKVPKAAMYGRAMAVGALADFTVFAEDEARLSNMLQQIPGLEENMVLEFLAQDDEDSAIESRLKNVLEGGMAGVAVDGVIRVLRGLGRRAKILRDPKMPQEKKLTALEETEKYIEDGAEQGLLGRAEARTLDEAEAPKPVDPLEPEAPKPAVVRDADLLDLDSMKYPELQAEAKQRRIKANQSAQVLREQIAGHRRNERGARASREGMINRLDDPVPGLPDVKMRGRGAAQIALEEGAITWDEGIELVKRIDDFIDSGADLMEKIPGLINTATLSTRANRALAMVYAENFPKGIKHLDSRGNQMDKAFTEHYTEEAAIRSFADMAGMSPKEMEIKMARDAASVGSASLNVQGYIHYIDNYFNHLMELGHAMKTGDPKALKELGMTQQQVTAAYGKAHQGAGELLKSFGGVRQEFGRGLYAFRTDVYGKAARLMNGEFAERMGREMGGRDHLVDIHDQLLELRGIGGLKNNAAMAQRLMRFDRKARATFMLNEYFVNMVLSSIRTLSTNTLGNTATTLFGPIEVMMGARVKKGIATLRGQDTKALTQEVHRATLELTELRSTFTMAAKWARKAWKKGDYIADPSHAFHDIPTHMKDAWGAENLGFITGRELDPAKGLGKAVEKFGTVLRLPSRSLMATDEFFKQWNYRSTVSADLILAGRIKVKNGEIKNLDEWVDKELHRLTRRGQFFVESNLQKEAAKRFKPEDARYNHGSGWDQMQRDRQGWIKKQMGDPAVLDRGAIGERAANISRERTFTNDLDPDNGVLSSLGVSMQKFGYKHPMFRLFVPFIRTPLNIFIYAGRRTAIPVVNRDLHQAATYLYKTKFGSKGLDAARTKMARELSSSDPRVQAEAMGRMTSAIGFGTVFVGLASSGILTGAGPKDKDRRAIMKQAGWQPYSVKIGDKYVSYQKLDPLATVTGIWADIVDFARYAERDGQPEVEKVMMGVIVSLAHNLQSKSYLQGLTQIAGVISDPEINASKMTGRLAAALTVPSLVASMRELTDPNMVEVRSVLDQVISRVPFLSTALLDPQRTVLGEAVDKKTMEGAERLASDLGGVFLPILTNTSTDDVIHRELAELGYPFGNPPRNKYGVDLTDHKNSKGQTAYDRWLELVGTTTLGLTTKRSLRSSLKRLINSRAYQALPVDGVSEVDQDSPRVALITRMITRYRAVARMQMLREFPDVARAARNQLVANRAMSQGVDPEMIRNQLFPME